MIKYIVNKVEVTEGADRDVSFLKGKMYRVHYTEVKFTWWNLKTVETQKEAYKRPFTADFRSADDGYKIPDAANECLRNYIDCNDL